MGFTETQRQQKKARLLPRIQEPATCSLTEPGLDPCPQQPLLWACAWLLHSQPLSPGVGSSAQADRALAIA